ncbi:teneurin-m [Caerostris extrusa]|uniref:Teneurin-m n=1 Tax=Caerostris extrusa TaxID=172846 RepID=A0AAV4T1Y9_CAEEX|nr:teneurin-m [Caerostris extrusa]
MEFKSEFRYQGILVREERQILIGYPFQYRYTGQSGSLEQVQQFLVHRPKVHNVFIQDEQRHFSKTIGHDSMDSYLYWLSLYGIESSETTEYSYTQDGYLAEVSGRKDTDISTTSMAT